MRIQLVLTRLKESLWSINIDNSDRPLEAPKPLVTTLVIPLSSVLCFYQYWSLGHYFIFLFCSVLNASGGFLKRPDFIEAVFSMLENQIDSPYLLGFLVDYLEAKLEKEANAEMLDKALKVWVVLHLYLLFDFPWKKTFPIYSHFKIHPDYPYYGPGPLRHRQIAQGS